ncbi:hypothetical protein ACT7DF_22475 [Bacillus cereus]
MYQLKRWYYRYSQNRFVIIFLVKINHDDDVILSEYRKLKSVEENLPEILMEVNHENISDYINLYFPQDSKFKKYWYGKGAGQS